MNGFEDRIDLNLKSKPATPEELKDLPFDPQTIEDLQKEPEYSPEEQREIEEALKVANTRRNKLKPKKTWKWKPKGLIVLYIFTTLFEFFTLLLLSFILLPWIINVPYSFNLFINIVCTLILAFTFKRWWKD